AYRKGHKLPSTRKVSKRIEELTSTPAAKKSRKKKSASLSKPADWTEYEKLAMLQAQANGQDVLHVAVKIDPHCAMPIAGRQLIQNAISSMGPVLGVRPDAKSAAASKHVEFVLASVQTPQQIIAKCKIPTIAEEVTVDLLYQATSPGSQAVPDTTSDSKEQEPGNEPGISSAAPQSESQFAASTLENILRVEASRIDSVLNLVGELIIGKSMLQQALNDFAKRYPKDLLRG
ncbi:MAG: hypothetical protein ACM3ND_03335, partial [Acidobacteriota bacterium]